MSWLESFEKKQRELNAKKKIAEMQELAAEDLDIEMGLEVHFDKKHKIPLEVEE